MLATGYLCGRCERVQLRLFRVLSVEQSAPNEVVIKHTCTCAPGVQLKGRYVIVPDLLYALFRNRVVRLPYHAETSGLRRIRYDHPDLMEMRAELANVRTVDDMFPPG